ncbi:MAG: hypothetical protein KA125_11115 [Chromatiaceae bacterium]|jgi:hypothetical protein|nr:hypothetical protein [Chromatiaceae bacterium]
MAYKLIVEGKPDLLVGDAQPVNLTHHVGTDALDRQIPRLEQQRNGINALDIEGVKDLLRR